MPEDQERNGLQEQAKRELAYQLWEEQGRPQGRELENWAEAEARLPAAAKRSTRLSQFVGWARDMWEKWKNTIKGKTQISKEKMDRIEFYSKLFGIIFGAAAATVALIQLQQGIVQRTEELGWKQAALAREMVNKMLDDEGWEAMLMLDWEDRGREFKIKQGQMETIKVEDVYKALNVEENVFTDKDVFIEIALIEYSF